MRSSRISCSDPARTSLDLSSLAPGKPWTYPAKCFLISRMPILSPWSFRASLRCFFIVGVFFERGSGVWGMVEVLVEAEDFLVNALWISRSNQGSPTLARPIMIPSRFWRRSLAVWTESMSPLPMTGILRRDFAR